jgi:tetratricopeptide (TPR) repeat protein
MKRCTRCKRELPVSCFGALKAAKDGLRYVCKECRNKEEAVIRKTDAYKERVTRWRKSERGRELLRLHRQKAAIKAYNKAYFKSDQGKASVAKYLQSDKYAERIKMWRKSESGQASTKAASARMAKTEKYKERVRIYMQSQEYKDTLRRYLESDKGKACSSRYVNKRRSRIEILSTLTAQEWADIKHQYKQKCIYCGEEKQLTMDHVIPISKGGHHVKENIVPACRSCNCRKGDKPVLLQLLVEASVVNSNL